MVVEPACDGDCEVSIEWKGPEDIDAMKWTSIMCLLIALLLIFEGQTALPSAAAFPPVMEPGRKIYSGTL